MSVWVSCISVFCKGEEEMATEKDGEDSKEDAAENCNYLRYSKGMGEKLPFRKLGSE